MITRRALGLLTLSLGAGCMLGIVERREDTLRQEARVFNDDLRWGRWEAATAAMASDEGKAFRARVAAAEKELVLADYEVTSITFARGSEAATVAARFEWYYQSDPRVRSTTLEQQWEHKDGRWQLTKQRRTRGDRFVLVTEPAAAPAPAAPTP